VEAGSVALDEFVVFMRHSLAHADHQTQVKTRAFDFFSTSPSEAGRKTRPATFVTHGVAVTLWVWVEGRESFSDGNVRVFQ